MKLRLLIPLLSLFLVISLRSPGYDSSDTTYVRFNTNLGYIDVQLLTHEAPMNVANFLSYANSVNGATYSYNNSVIHRSTTVVGNGVAVVQGGAFQIGTDGYLLDSISLNPPVMGEPGVSNVRGTLALALPSDSNGNAEPNAGTSSWYFNETDNTGLDGTFTVFGAIANANSLSVMDQISQVPVYDFGGALTTIPILPPYTEADLTANDLPTAAEFVTVYSITPLILENFSAWQTSTFTSTQQQNTNFIAASSTPWNDGVSNLLKYLCDINPSAPMTSTARARLPTAGTTKINGSQYLTLTWHQNSSLVGVTVTVQTSTDLQTWTPVAQPTIVQTGSDSGTGDPILQVQVPASGAEQFVRLSVSQSS